MKALDLRRISVVGSSGSGKTTMGRRLASRFGLPVIELDALYHGPGWVNPSREEFQRIVEDAIADERWVVDGKYASVRERIWERATLIVWLDLPRWRCTLRAVRRTTWRAIARTQLWNGNREPLLHFFARDGVIRYGFRNYRDTRARMEEQLASPRFTHVTVIRLRTPREVRGWFNALPSHAPGAR